MTDSPDTAPSAADVARRFQALHEIVRDAHARLDRNIWDYLVGGAETETTLRRNRLAIDSLALRPNVLANVARVDSTATFFGEAMRLPVFLAPVGSLGSFWTEGQAAVARAAAARGVPMFVSSVIPEWLEKAAAASAGPKVFQCYPRGDGAYLDDQVKRAVDAGYRAFCLTVDNPVASRRERDIVKRYEKPWVNADGMDYQAALSWADVERLRARHALPLIVKGIATAEDAQRACETGVQAVYVSNHGGRQLDHGRGAIEVLPEVVAAVRGRAKVFVDGGFSRGTDVLKALALGADNVGIGRLYLYGLAAAGEAGVARVLDILEDEIRIALALLGAHHFGALKPSHLHAASPVGLPHVLSAFPLLKLDEDRY